MADRHAAPTLLIGEDDRALSAILTDLFTDEGYLVDVAHDGQQGLHRGLTGSYDAVIVDRGLPVMGGAEVVAVLRSRDIATPALPLTAGGSVADRVDAKPPEDAIPADEAARIILDGVAVPHSRRRRRASQRARRHDDTNGEFRGAGGR